jgi:ketosteroid isomerase-like protein
MTEAPSAVARATTFIDALDRNDAEALRAIADPAGTWWVDTGLDRASGADGVDPGADRPWPLHGTMGLGEKLALLDGLPSRFPDGCRQRRWNAFGGDDVAVVEVDGDGTYLGGRPYRNRYAFVITVADGRVQSVREYLDTEHAAQVFSGRHLDRRTEAPAPIPSTDLPDGPLADLARRFVAGVEAANPGDIAPLMHDDATWWADSGVDRDAGRRDIEPYRGPRAPLVGLAMAHDRIVHLPGITSMFEDGWHLVVRRLVIGEDIVAVEAASDGLRSGGARYQNRYCFVLDVRDGRISHIREYCDTRHAFDVFRVPRSARLEP